MHHALERGGIVEEDRGAHVRQRLRKSEYSELWHISCKEHQGVLTLQGCVSSFYLKQVAQTLAGQVPGIGQVVNRIEVTYCKVESPCLS
jgi:osmotically-inducible protein OsmY